MSNIIRTFLSKLDYRVTSSAFSRPGWQVQLIVKTLRQLHPKKFEKVLDVGGGDAQYRDKLLTAARKYINMEVQVGKSVDIVGSAYNISTTADLVSLFMVLEHLNNPQLALRECTRVLKKGGYLVLTTVQYWHTHNHPSDYFRYTKAGLQHLCKEAGLKVVKIWSMGGPFLVVFHAIELNLSGNWRTIFSILFYRIFDLLDWLFYKHNDPREHSDSVGWSLIARKA